MSHHTTDEQPLDIKEIREARGLSQAAFWGAIGVKQPAGSDYEHGREMPEPVRRLVTVHYVAEIPTDADPAFLARVGRLAGSMRGATRDLARANALLETATAKVIDARSIITGDHQ